MSVDNFNCAPFFLLAFAVCFIHPVVALCHRSDARARKRTHEQRNCGIDGRQVKAWCRWRILAQLDTTGESSSWAMSSLPITLALKYLDLGLHPRSVFCATSRHKNHLPHLQRRPPLRSLMTDRLSKPDQHGKSCTNRHDGREYPRASPPPLLRPCRLSRLPNRICLLGLNGDVRAACCLLVLFSMY
jgi:hypothetical protein